MLLMSVVAFAQNQIKGHVADATGEPIIGANVTVKGTTTGTITDIDGNFTLEVESTDGTLVVSFIGYKSVEAKMNGTAPINVVLQEDTETLDEVVVVGYGTQNRKSLTGAISDVKSESLTRQFLPLRLVHLPVRLQVSQLVQRMLDQVKVLTWKYVTWVLRCSLLMVFRTEVIQAMTGW